MRCRRRRYLRHADYADADATLIDCRYCYATDTLPCFRYYAADTSFDAITLSCYAIISLRLFIFFLHAICRYAASAYAAITLLITPFCAITIFALLLPAFR